MMWVQLAKRIFAGAALLLGCALPLAAQTLPNPIVFVSQTPDPQGVIDFNNMAATFGNHQTGLRQAPRGGSLHVLYPNGTVRDLLADALAEACTNSRPTCDANGVFKLGGGGDPLLLINGYAVREPTVHWDGDKVIFSLLKNVAQQQFQSLPADTLWQIYEISGLTQGAQPVLTKLANQPAYNNVSPIYGSDDQIFFASDRPITGLPYHLQLDEYESTPTVAGLYKLNPASGELKLLVHAPSGVFSLFLDSFGQVVFMQWDHLRQDQQAFKTLRKTLGLTPDDFWQAYTYNNENDNDPASRVPVSQFITEQLALNTPEGDLKAYGLGERHVPEYGSGHPILSSLRSIQAGRQIGATAATFLGRELKYFTPQNKYGKFDGSDFNVFFTWQINQDGTRHETFRHTGRDELQHYLARTYFEDSALSDKTQDTAASPLAGKFGHFNVVEAPVSPGVPRGIYVGVASDEFNTHSTGFILQMTDLAQAISENGSNVQFTKLTVHDSKTLYRNPVFLSDGTLIATVDELPTDQKAGQPNNFLKTPYRLYRLVKNGAFYVPDQPLMPATLDRTFNFWSPDQKLSFSGPLWQVWPTEVRVRQRPPLTAQPALPSPELSVFAEKGVDPQAFQQFLVDNKLALIVSRNVTKRDLADTRQPFNLRVEPANVPPGKTGAMTVKPGFPNATVYDVARLQIYQNDLLRGYAARPSNMRRGLARPMHYPPAVNHNPPTGLPVSGSTKIAHDGSFAAFVPSDRAVTWTLNDKDGDIVLRERFWLTFSKGEVRVCAACHGINQTAQDGSTSPTQPPQALRDLLDYWKQSQGQPTLNVLRVGSGTGTVASVPAGINCGADCSETIASGTSVTLNATPGQGSGFGGWSGVTCSGGNASMSCSFTLTANTTVSATFDSSLVVANDFNDDARSDLLWRNGADGSVQGWLMNGLSATQVAGLLPAGGYTITHVADLDGNGKADTLIRHADGTTIGWLHDCMNIVGQATFFAAGSGWSIKHTADLNGDGKADLIVDHTDGTVVGWLMNGLTVIGTATFVPAGTGWSVSQVGDLNGDGKADLIWQNSNGTVQAWLMDGLSATQTATFVGSGTGWSVKLVGDFNGDGKTDLMWQNTDGTVQAWLMDGTAISQIASFVPAGTGWSPVLAGDIDGDGKADLFWEHTDGRSQTWLMNGLTVTNLAGFVGAGGWRATHLLDLNGDGKKDVLWKHDSGTVQAWLLNGLTITQIASLAGAGGHEVIPPRP